MAHVVLGRLTLRIDEALKMAAAQKTGPSAAIGYAWSIRFAPNHALQASRDGAERASKRYG
ncbi:MAG: hypothetical protein AAGH70_02550 [Pseudomonadota bacterium]